MLSKSIQTMKRRFSLIVLILIASGSLCAWAEAPTCTYSSYRWNVAQQRSVEPEQIRKPYATLTTEEVDPVTKCSVCEEDQETIAIKGVPPFQMCKALAKKVRTALTKAIEAGARIRSVTGWRVGRTRGDLDAHGLRTVFSNHSYGIAIDINVNENGLYGDCYIFGPKCRRMRGGEWNPSNAGAITKEKSIYHEMTKAGFKWGGEIAGSQKDFMHFSPTGY